VTFIAFPHVEEILKRHLDCIYVNFGMEFCKKQKIHFIYLYPLFINKVTSPEIVINNYFIKDDEHWNKQGHKLVADFIFNNLKE